METDKKKYLFRLGPFSFLQMNRGEISQEAKDKDEKWMIFIRFLLIVIFCKYTYNIFSSSGISNVFASTEDYSAFYYIILFAPLLMSIGDIHTVLKSKKAGIPLKPMTRYSIYGMWLASAIFYGMYIYIGFLN
jgi:hypothetical protein